MRKTTKITKTIEEEKYFCDCCGKEFHWSSGDMNQCWVCKNMMCSDCRRKSPVDNDTDLWHEAYGSDRHICKDCEKVIKPFADNLNELWKTYQQQKVVITKEMRVARGK